MNETRSKGWNASYARLRTARANHNLLVARQHAGLDLATGMKPAEVLRLSQFKLWLRQAQFAVVGRSNRSAVDDEFDVLIGDASAAVEVEGSTQEFQDALGDLLSEAVDANEARRKTYPATDERTDTE